MTITSQAGDIIGKWTVTFSSNTDFHLMEWAGSQQWVGNFEIDGPNREVQSKGMLGSAVALQTTDSTVSVQLQIQ